MMVRYATDNVTTPADYVPGAQWGTSAGGLTSSATGFSTSYIAFDILSPVFHFVNMTGLTPYTQYYYRVGTDANGWSEVLNFTTAPALGDRSSYPVDFAAYGDAGILHSNYTFARIGAMLTDPAGPMLDFVVHAGDVSYADDRASINKGSIYDGIFSDFDRMIENTMSRYAGYMTSVGNHEAILDFSAYRNRIMPSLPGAANYSSTTPTFWYSWNYGPLHFLAFSVEHTYTPGSAQYAFMQADLAAVDRSVTPWVIAYAHRPLICSNTFWCPDQMPLRDAIEPLFLKYNVDIFLSGHVHAAELIYPSINGSVLQSNFSNTPVTTHLMVGFPGDIEVCCSTWYQPQPAYSAWRADDQQYFGFSTLHIANDTHFRIQAWDAVNNTVNMEQWVSRVFPVVPRLQ